MRTTAAMRTTTASRPLLESQTKISHAEPAALLDPTRASAQEPKAANRLAPVAALRQTRRPVPERSSTPKPRQRPPQATIRGSRRADQREPP